MSDDKNCGADAPAVNAVRWKPICDFHRARLRAICRGESRRKRIVPSAPLQERKQPPRTAT